MKTWVIAGILIVLCVGLRAQNPQLTAQDRTDIQALVTGYAKALGSCAASDYADLFAEKGYFASGFRGQVAGREKFIAMVQSERQCINPNPAPSTAQARPGPTVVINVTPAGVFGLADLGAAGAYEDEYVKTPKGWRLKERAHVRDKGRPVSSYTEGVYPMGDPRGPATGDRRRLKAR